MTPKILEHQNGRRSFLAMAAHLPFQLQALLALSLLLGGGGVAYGIRNLIIQLVALSLLAVNFNRVRQFFSHSSRVLIALVGLTLALPLIQLVPLPPGLWQAMPGREPIIEALAIANISAETWMPWSVDRARTLVAFSGLIAPATIVVLGATLDSDEVKSLVRAMAVFALCAFAWGVIQLTSANTVGLLYPVRINPSAMYGAFANRNSMGLYFVIAMTLGAALPFPKGQIMKIVRVVVLAFLLFGAVLTQSRSSMVLLLVPIGFIIAKLAWAYFARTVSAEPNSGVSRFGGRSALALLFGAVLAGALSISFVTGGRVADSLERFNTIETDRIGMWDDAQYAAKHYWPAGSGMGTFDEVFQLHESLEYISPRRAGRAHNDYLELGMEAGLAGLVVLLGWVLWLIVSTWNWKRRPDPWLALGGAAGLLCILLQSLLDYPLRNQAVLCAAALLIVTLAGKERIKQTRSAS